jgi:hypothetical protein
VYQSHLIKQYDVVGFDQIAGSSYNADDDKNLYKNYMESCQINRGTVTVVGNAGFVFKADSGVWSSLYPGGQFSIGSRVHRPSHLGGSGARSALFLSQEVDQVSSRVL